MLVVVVLLPIVLILVACLLERFEAHAIAEKPAPRVRRPLPASATTGSTVPATPTLALVPGADEGTVEGKVETVDHAAAASALRRAS